MYTFNVDATDNWYEFSYIFAKRIAFRDYSIVNISLLFIYRQLFIKTNKLCVAMFDFRRLISA